MTVACVCASILDKKYSGFPVASMKIGCRMRVHAVAATLKTLGVTAPARLAQIVAMLVWYVVVILLMLLLTVVIRLSLYTTTLCMLKASGCRRVSEIVCIRPPPDMHKTDVFEKRNPRQHLPAGASVAPRSTCDVVT